MARQESGGFEWVLGMVPEAPTVRRGFEQGTPVQSGWPGWGESYHLGVGALDTLAATAREQGLIGECARAHRAALGWAATYATLEPCEESIKALLDRIVRSGNELLDLEQAADLNLVRACARPVRSEPDLPESPLTTRGRSPALSILATLGADMPEAEREALIGDAWAWFERGRSRLGILTGYESEIRCGVVTHGAEERCRTLAALEQDVVPDIGTPPEERTSMEWRILVRLRRLWGCELMARGVGVLVTA